MNSTSFTLKSPAYKRSLDAGLASHASDDCIPTHLALDASTTTCTPVGSQRSSESEAPGRSPSVTVLTAIGSNSFLHHETSRPFQFIGGGFSLSSRLSLSNKYQRSGWSRSSHLEKLLSLAVVLLFIVTISLSVGLLSIVLTRNNNHRHRHHGAPTIDDYDDFEQHQHQQEVCLTPDCVKVAASVIEAIDATVDPCDDFYMYSCGDWIKANPLPDGKSVWGSFSKIWQDNQEIIRSILEDSSNFKPGSAEEKARVYYDSCIDKNDILEERGTKPVQDLIDKVGGWNISGQPFDVDKWNLADVIQVFHNQYNRGGLFLWAVNADERNSSRNIIQLDQGGLGLPSKNYYLNKTDKNVLEAYQAYMNKVFQMMGGVHVEEQVSQVLEFEKKLAEITIPPDQRRDDERIYHKFTLGELNKRCPFLNWTRYFSEAFDYHSRTGITFAAISSSLQNGSGADKLKNQTKYSVLDAGSGFGISKRLITDDEQVVVYSPEYFEDLSDLIMEHTKTRQGKTAVANYLVWSVVQSLITTMPREFREVGKSLRKALVGSEGLEIPWRFCVSDTNQALGFALSSSFVRKVFEGSSKVRVEEMISLIRTAFKDSLSELSWMDDKTRHLAKEKADYITQMIGFPDFILNSDSLNEKYEGLELEEDKYFENAIKATVLMLRENMEKLSKPANKSEWDVTPSTVNAYYTPTKNQIVFPAGILQTPFYNPQYPNSLNYGAMGVVMGHELTHAFDDQGREYDKNGNLYQWWDNETLRNFEERVKCFSEQYSSYEIDGNNLNGKQSLGENIADNGGIKAAFKAYERWSARHPEPPLPGLNLTHKQLFFVGFAQVWCSVSTPEAIKLQVMNDPHAPARYRVIGTISNSLEFAREFGCARDSPMNPNKKCIVW